MRKGAATKASKRVSLAGSTTSDAQLLGSASTLFDDYGRQSSPLGLFAFTPWSEKSGYSLIRS